MLVSNQERKQALGDFTNPKENNYYTKLCKLFTPMNTPQPGDWLHGHKEVHQAYANYKLPYYNEVTAERNVIYIQEFGKFNKEFMKELTDFCSVFYLTLKVKCLPPLDFQTELSGIKKRKNCGNDQYLAQDILAYMQKKIPKDAYCVMGITLKDIYPGDNWNFVYGWAKYKARVGIFSFVRWDDDFFYGEKNAIDWKLIRYPSMRTMVHQIGHMFAVTHCVYNRCLMNGFNNIEENYKNPLEFCPICYRKICKNIGFDKAERHKRLIEYCEKSDVEELKKDQLLYEEILKLDIELGPEAKQNNLNPTITNNLANKPTQNVINKPNSLAKPIQKPSVGQTNILAQKPNSKSVFKPNSLAKPIQKPSVGQTNILAQKPNSKSVFKPNLASINGQINGIIPLYKQMQKKEFSNNIIQPSKPSTNQKPVINAANNRGKNIPPPGARKN